MNDDAVVVVALGNDFRGDDGAGVLFGRLLKEQGLFTVIEGGDAPENVTGPIVGARAEAIVIADALDFGGKPGEFTFISVEKLSGSGISTHYSLCLFVDYLKLMTGAGIHVLGFQPEKLGIGEGLSVTVRTCVETTARAVLQSGGFERLYPDTTW